MAENRRWLTSISKEAAKAQIKMPWERGAPRAAFIAKRAAAAAATEQKQVPPKVASA